MCVPIGSDYPIARRVCTKGCNRLLKAIRNKRGKTESEIYDLVACQADKQVICDPAKSGGGDTSGKQGWANTCRVSSTFVALAVCSFDAELWNLGATCISNHVQGNEHPQCPDGANVALIKKFKCRAATNAANTAGLTDHDKCGRLGMVF